MFSKKDRYINSEEVNKQIKEITMGKLGKCLKYDHRDLWISVSVDDRYEYKNDVILLKYNANGIESGDSRHILKETFSVYYKQKLVYRDEYMSPPAWKKNSDNVWLRELYRVYKMHLYKIKQAELEYKKKQERIQKSAKIDSIFLLIYPNNYVDDKIVIDNLQYVSMKSNSDGDYDSFCNGRISLPDGTVVCDTAKNIHHPGMWEDYVCSLVDIFKEKKRYEQQLKIEKEKEERRLKELEKARVYKLNHTPIDDSKYFK